MGGAREHRRRQRRGLPVAEFVHPYPLLALGILALNDHLLKGSAWLPGWLTGKLSDVTGLFVFPLLLTAVVDTVLYYLHQLSRARFPGYELTMAKIGVAVFSTGLGFTVLKLSPAASRWAAALLERSDVFHIFIGFQITPDPTDLVALLVLPLCVIHARRFVPQPVINKR